MGSCVTLPRRVTSMKRDSLEAYLSVRRVVAVIQIWNRISVCDTAENA